jgi:DNA helicase-2/ATP-dependent DNA helicase PcrA
MRLITDLHIHSRFSRACSKDLTIPNIARASQSKGIQWVATGDALHPAWRQEIGESLEERDGAYYLHDDSSSTAFCLSTEVSCIYKRADKVRRLHHVILFPDLIALDKTIKVLADRGFNLKSDGRPIMGLDSEELLKMLLDVDGKILLIPAHAWTPWFAVFGSKSGFDSLEECFGEHARYIYAIETGLSSDPPMNWRVSALDHVFLVSDSDAHSCENLGREANVFDMEKPSYAELHRILAEHDTSRFIETFEFFPEEGKYHADGHADCGFWCDPQKTKKLNGRCPKCGKPLTVGVLSRVNDLADRSPNPPRPPGSAKYRSLVPLRELVADCLGEGKTSKAVVQEMEKMKAEASEFAILLDLEEQVLSGFCRPEVVEGISRMRRGEVEVRPGYDGVFGQVHVKDTSSLKSEQQGLFT